MSVHLHAKSCSPSGENSVHLQRNTQRLCLDSNDEYIFLNPQTGKPITTLKTAHATAIKRSGLDHFRIYDLRHTFATRFVESFGDVVTLKELLGHANTRMVERYAHPTEQHKFDAIRKMEEQRSKSAKKVFGKSA